MKISIGSDHGGFELKTILVKYLTERKHRVTDHGCKDESAVDYPDIAFDLCAAVANGESELGILVCGTGIGMSNAAGKVKGIIPALCTDPYMARMSRQHNAANVLCLGGRVIGSELAKEIVDAYLGASPLADEKYQRRRKKISEYEGMHSK